MLELVITGGQTGADLAAWRAAKAAGIATRGWMVRGYRNEDGPHLEYARLYGARAIDAIDYAERTRRNVDDADAALVFCTLGGYRSPGTALTRGCARRRNKPFAVAFYQSGAFDSFPPRDAAVWIEGFDVRSLMVAGNRESVAPGIGAAVEAYLADVFMLLGVGEPSRCKTRY